jgi:hypothetical protein
MRNVLFNVSIAVAMAAMFVVMFWATLRMVGTAPPWSFLDRGSWQDRR